MSSSPFSCTISRVLSHALTKIFGVLFGERSLVCNLHVSTISEQSNNPLKWPAAVTESKYFCINCRELSPSEVGDTIRCTKGTYPYENQKIQSHTPTQVSSANICLSLPSAGWSFQSIPPVKESPPIQRLAIGMHYGHLYQLQIWNQISFAWYLPKVIPYCVQILRQQLRLCWTSNKMIVQAMNTYRYNKNQRRVFWSSWERHFYFGCVIAATIFWHNFSRFSRRDLTDFSWCNQVQCTALMYSPLITMCSGMGRGPMAFP